MIKSILKSLMIGLMIGFALFISMFFVVLNIVLTTRGIEDVYDNKYPEELYTINANDNSITLFDNCSVVSTIDGAEEESTIDEFIYVLGQYWKLTYLPTVEVKE